MTIRRKRRHDKPVKCSLCKEIRAFHTVHGYLKYGGRTCCNECFPSVKSEYDKEMEREANYEMTEADYQTWGRL